MKILTFSTLYPNKNQPNNGIFVENRLRHLLKDTKIQATVVAPVPWVPSFFKKSKSYGSFVSIPKVETRHNITIHHPRYLVIPKIGWYITPLFMYLATRNLIKQLHTKEKFDLIDAHYFYPDGVAAAALAQKLKLPFTITGRGTDLTLIPKYFLPRKMIEWASKKANALITVSASLKDDIISLNIDPNKITPLRNGIDLELFHTLETNQIRQFFSFPHQKKILLSVGYLIERKGNEFTITALASLPHDFHLVLAGSGPEEIKLKKIIHDLHLNDRVTFLGQVPHHDLIKLYNAADCLILASSREGWPNVLLEAIACGCPVVSTRVNGTPEIILKPEAGILIDDRKPETIAKGILELFKNLPSRAETSAYAKDFTWKETSLGQEKIFKKICKEHKEKRTINSSS